MPNTANAEPSCPPVTSGHAADSALLLLPLYVAGSCFAEEVLPKIARAVGAGSVYCHGEVTAEETKVEAAVTRALDKAGATLKVSRVLNEFSCVEKGAVACQCISHKDSPRARADQLL